MKYFYSLIFLISLGILAAQPMQAASFILQTDLDLIEKNGEGKIDILLATQGEKINALGGELNILDGEAALTDIRDGESIISVWLDRPLITDSKTIAFSGIIPGGFKGLYGPNFASPQPGLIMSFNIKAKSKGKVLLGLKNTEAYVGLGEPVKILLDPEVLILDFDKAASEVAPEPLVDNLAPINLDLKIIKLTTEPKGWYAIFSAEDRGSGIDHYELQESWSNEFNASAWRRADSPFRLIDQKRQKYVFVKAVDRSGNEAIAFIAPEANFKASLLPIISAIIIVLFSLLILLNRRRSKK